MWYYKCRNSCVIKIHNFWRTTEMPLINCKINVILTWSANCVISTVNRETNFAIADARLYLPVVALSNNDNAKLL